VGDEPVEKKKDGGGDEEDGDEGDGDEEEQEGQQEQKEEKTATGKKKRTLLVAKYLKTYDPKLRVGGSFRAEQISQTVLRVLMRQFGRVHSGMVRSIL
jgi:TATA-binding protein-associated factor Taf7